MSDYFEKTEEGYFAGCAGGVLGADEDGADDVGVDVGTDGAGAGGGVLTGSARALSGRGGAGVPLTTDPRPRWPTIANPDAPHMNSTASPAVTFASTAARARAPQ